VLAISKNGDVQPTKIANTRLGVGDTLLIQGHAPDVDRVRERRQLIVLGELEHHKVGAATWLTIGLLAAVLAAAEVISHVGPRPLTPLADLDFSHAVVDPRSWIDH